jgi:hypothetical protein
MADMLADGLAFLTKTLKASASQTVTYARGTQSVQAQATFGNKLLKLTDEFGQIRMQWTDMDFCIPASDLPFATWSGPDNPDRGDLVYVSQPDQNQVQVFEVFPFGTEPPWRWADPHQSMYRVHCKYIDKEALVV